jgi:peroxiredoxin
LSYIGGCLNEFSAPISMNIITSRNSQWMKAILVIAGIYNLAWGASVILFPDFWFRIANMEPPNYLQIWQALGMVVGVYGIGYIIAASNPLRHWPIVLVGFLGKIFGPLGFLYYYLLGELPLTVLNMHFTNDIIWWLPFGIILYNAYRHDYLLDNEMIHFSEHDPEELLSWHSTNKGDVLLELSRHQPVMLVFLRHFGCTFCRTTLREIARYRDTIESRGTKIILIHQLSEEAGTAELRHYHLHDIEHVSDPELVLYKGFHLRRGTLSQLFGVKEIAVFVQKGLIGGLGIGAPGDQDPFQMPGIFLVQDGKILKQFLHRSASETPPYLELATPDYSVV